MLAVFILHWRRKIMCGIIVSTDYLVDLEKFKVGFEKIDSRGPDSERLEINDYGVVGFKRLSIMGLQESGMQPFHLGKSLVVCNGEIYGYKPIKEELSKEYKFASGSDCEIILPLYQKYGVEMFRKLDAEFAMVIYDGENDIWVAGRDPIGIRPLFYGYTKSGKISFASEAKALLPFCKKVTPFPPGHYYFDGEFVEYNDIYQEKTIVDDSLDLVLKNIHDLLIEGIEKRMDADAPVGYLLSGGLDSSLVCAIAQSKSDKPIRTFSIGMELDAIDLKYAKQVADFIGSDHTEVVINKEDVIGCIDEVVETLESFDITTIRASVGMYKLCQYIHKNTDIKVLFSGEISDEIFGYKYTDYAPNPQEFQKEARKRVKELYYYDVLRADRCISSNSLEARVPFGDIKFVEYVMSINPKIKMNTYDCGKYLLRKAFLEDKILPENILFRDKAAFSDAVGHSLVDDIKEHAEEKFLESELEELFNKYSHATPYTKESLMYREIFCKYYPEQQELIKGYWLPNQSWEGCQVNDPSARYLSNYGKSGE
jgi:asparagine synthase (glutamine-hydrolysing)